ncbi:hypothetical protein P3626_23485 [Vibrio parahaemolyticus]|nr:MULTISPECIES: hypothetical protein [Vibrio harveyi group]QCO86312.1 hypothetical protein D3H41_09515 [Vibrio neocaledonicus]EHH2535413.1 hypothetical protein [Vibrio parahaemolyticus]EHR5764845.1 hypothetical protein [Vibrio parahaemolyticus]EHR6783033.1 hypothetical protein [Vibrio parahaemolyticus]EHY0932722.1 hypothetical protein [Vibrio parahaemolyticus]
MHTPIKFYISLPFDLFRLGRKTKAKFDYIRTSPPRDMEAVWDLKIYNKNGIEFVDCKSGGLSLFNYRNPRFGTLWWKIPQHTKMPNGLHVSLDEGGNKGKHHFTIRPLQDMPLSLYLTKLQQLESSARPCFINSPNSQVG